MNKAKKTVLMRKIKVSSKAKNCFKKKYHSSYLENCCVNEWPQVHEKVEVQQLMHIQEFELLD